MDFSKGGKIMILWGIFSYAVILIGEISSVKRVSRFGGHSLFLLMFILNAFRYDGADITVYYQEFEESGQSDWDFWNSPFISKTTQQFIFFYFNKIFYELNLGFDVMHFCMVAVGMTMMWYLVRRITTNWPMVYAVYFLYPCPYDIVQTRNFLMSLFFFYSIWFMSQAKHHPYKTYTFWNVLGLGFHTAGILNFLFLCFYKLRKWKIFLSILLIMGLITPFLFSSLKAISVSVLSLIAVPGTPLEALQIYLVYAEQFTPDDTVGNPLFFFLFRIYTVVVVGIMFGYLAMQWIQKKQKSLGIEKRIRSIAEYSYARMVTYMCAYLISILPILSYTASMERYARNVILPVYVLGGILWGYLDKRIRICILVIILLTIILYYLLAGNSGLFAFMGREYMYNAFFDLFE